ncbi:MAG: cell division protein FtsA, partial [Candidatus Omnitrophica bacterium]|nr:cell division protein FtsA [Candidatus Omnitrophota bacterium]
MSTHADDIFALDIGTRKVIGMVARQEGQTLRIVDAECVEHQSRTMLDGQIHNITEVAKVVAHIKHALEQRRGITLRQAGVALAGRSLKTFQKKSAKPIDLLEEISETDVRNLEMEAVGSLLRDSDKQWGSGEYYCVGYSVVYYALDGVAMGTLVGHQGKTMEVEIIATFLPRVVLNSMVSVLKKAGLEAANVTLEPIAAITAIIPQDIRKLNILLLDIGAGTSDIALTKNGMISAYGMVPEAGDE